MEARIDAIQKHTADLLALERHILEAIERQRGADVLKTEIEANKIAIQIERTLTTHITVLETLVEEYGGAAESIFKKAITEVLGGLAGLYDLVREHPVSRMLRDDYTALSLTAMAYTAYHTFGLAIGEQKIADIAEKHLREITPILVELSKVLPHVVAREVAAENDEFPVDASVGELAERNTQRAWRPEVTEVV